MGKDKAFLKVRGKMLIDHAIFQAHSVADDIFIVGPREQYGAFGRIVKDIYPNCGPLGGVHAALNRSRTKLSLMLALDTPLITAELLKYLVSEAKSSGRMVTVPRTRDGLQPLCGIYNYEFLAIAQEALEAGKYKINALFQPELTHILEIAEHPEFDPAMFANINSPEDLQRADAKSKSAKNS